VRNLEINGWRKGKVAPAYTKQMMMTFMRRAFERFDEKADEKVKPPPYDRMRILHAIIDTNTANTATAALMKGLALESVFGIPYNPFVSEVGKAQNYFPVWMTHETAASNIRKMHHQLKEKVAAHMIANNKNYPFDAYSIGIVDGKYKCYVDKDKPAVDLIEGEKENSHIAKYLASEIRNKHLASYHKDETDATIAMRRFALTNQMSNDRKENIEVLQSYFPRKATYGGYPRWETTVIAVIAVLVILLVVLLFLSIREFAGSPARTTKGIVRAKKASHV